MQRHFNDLADHIATLIQGDEVFTASFDGEDSDFVRLNHSKIRQAGHVTQATLGIGLIDGGRHVGGAVTLSGSGTEDRERVAGVIADLRDKLALVPEDPHLLIATEVNSSEHVGTGDIPDADTAMEKILSAGEGLDMVGLFASGSIHAGFANSYGQRNWFTSSSFNLDWSFYLEADKAVKTGYAGSHWDDADFDRKVQTAAEQLEILKRPSRTVKPGRYRVYMAPAALADYVGMLGWGGVGLKSRMTKSTALLRMVEGDARMHPSLTVTENTAGGVAPNFQGDGFVKPDHVTLIDGGTLGDPLVSPRSAKEYDVPGNGANSWEYPESLDIAAGDLAEADAVRELGTGLYINNLHYLNWSDRPGCRITGMTRFATFWVENGEITAPLSVMRFDETMYRALGENLIGLTREREMLLDAGTYGSRQTSSVRAPGALVEDFNFNL